MDGEVIAVHLGNGHYFSFIDTAATVFCALANGALVSEIEQAITALDSPSRSTNELELHDWITRLLDEGLFVLSEVSLSHSQEERDKWLSAIATCKSRHLSFERFTDIEALLALDPVHDISSAGWPSRN